MDRIECLLVGNRCPECGSKRIVEHCQYAMYVNIDVRTGKEIFKDHTGKRVYKPSNKLIASYYKASQIDATCWLYECSKCGWRSEMFTQ